MVNQSSCFNQNYLSVISCDIKYKKMRFPIFIISAVVYLISGMISTEAQTIPDRWDYDVLLHEKVHPVENIPMGPFVRLGEGRILSVDRTEILISEDEGESWQAHSIFENPDDFEMPARAVTRTDNGVVVIAFYNLRERHWTWDDELRDAPGARLPNYVVRSLDDGRSWEEPVKLHEDWTGSVRDMIVTSEGYIVFTSMMMLHNPGRHTVLTYMSDDEGETWHRSNIIDLGGVGHHGGVTEATLEELKDGRLMKLIRTNWMQFWRAESKDGGRTWHPLGPSGIAASSAPANLRRLESGRLLLVWNQPYPEGETTYRMVGGDGIWSAVPVSNHRAELSVAFSEDDGKTWSDPAVIARTDTGGYRRTGAGGESEYMPQREVSYPYIFEVSPGEIWVTTPRGPLRAKFYEKDFIESN